MQLSVIVLNYNVRYFLEICLQSVFAAIANIDAEVIVIDNNSVDDSCDMVTKKFPKAVLIQNKKNVGFAKANNIAARQARGEYLCILNPDTIVPEDIFENCLKKAIKIDNLGFLGVQLLDGKGRFLPESKRNVPTPKVSLFKIFGKKLSFVAPYYADHVAKQDNGPIAILVGAFMFCRASVYQKLGGFDERYFMYGEDIDLSFTALSNGYTNYYFGESHVLHFKGESSFKDEVYRTRFFNAMQLFYAKHFKKQAWQNSLVQLGIKLAAFKASKKTKEIINLDCSQAIMYTSQSEMVQRIQKSMELPVEIAKTKTEQPQVATGEVCLCILDLNWLTFKEALNIVKAAGNAQTYFRFVPKNCAYLIGSDSSTALGSVVFF